MGGSGVQRFQNFQYELSTDFAQQKRRFDQTYGGTVFGYAADASLSLGGVTLGLGQGVVNLVFGTAELLTLGAVDAYNFNFGAYDYLLMTAACKMARQVVESSVKEGTYGGGFATRSSARCSTARRSARR